MTNPVSPEELKRKLLDHDGENLAVRAFLALYGGNNAVTTNEMRYHLAMSGFDTFWPQWVEENMHLSKGGAQSWLRYLLALEGAPAASGATPEWQPIETAPKDGTGFIARSGYKYDNEAFYCVWGIRENHFVKPEYDSEGWVNPTHWMPIPAAPLPPDPNAPNDKVEA